MKGRQCRRPKNQRLGKSSVAPNVDWIKCVRLGGAEWDFYFG